MSEFDERRPADAATPTTDDRVAAAASRPSPPSDGADRPRVGRAPARRRRGRDRLGDAADDDVADLGRAGAPPATPGDDVARRGRRRADAGRRPTTVATTRRRGRRPRTRTRSRRCAASCAPQFGDWYVVHSYAGYENKVKTNLESRIPSLDMEDYIFQVEVPDRGGRRDQERQAPAGPAQGLPGLHPGADGPHRRVVGRGPQHPGRHRLRRRHLAARRR